MAASSSAPVIDNLPEHDGHYRATYEGIHVAIGKTAQIIKEQFQPDLIVAIAGGGLFPARVLRTFLKKPSLHDPKKLRNIPIQAIGLALYEEVAGTSVEAIGAEVIRTQWLNEGSFKRSKMGGSKDNGLLGKNILIVDEVDDTRSTLAYAYTELLKDVKHGLSLLSPEDREQMPPTRFAIFVVHNKEKAEGKKGHLPIFHYNHDAAQVQPEVKLQDQPVEAGVGAGVFYYAGEEIGGQWVDYPWETEDILLHNAMAERAVKQGLQ